MVTLSQHKTELEGSWQKGLKRISLLVVEFLFLVLAHSYGRHMSGSFVSHQAVCYASNCWPNTIIIRQCLEQLKLLIVKLYNWNYITELLLMTQIILNIEDSDVSRFNQSTCSTFYNLIMSTLYEHEPHSINKLLTFFVHSNENYMRKVSELKENSFYVLRTFQFVDSEKLCE